MGFCIGSALCCAGQMCCGLLCKPCSALGVHAKNYTKVGYTFFQLFWVLFGLFMFMISDKLMKVKIVSQMIGTDVVKL